MSRFKQFDSDQVNDYSLRDRPSKVSSVEFARPVLEDSISALTEALPDILGARDLKLLARRIQQARARGKPIIWGFGGHVIKVGLSPVLIDLMQRGFITALATNGSGLIHDFEIAYCGQTSEDVEQQINSGAFGMARETGEMLNEAVERGAQRQQGIGEAIGEYLQTLKLDHPELSLFLQAHLHGLPLTVHVALGTDIIHNHPRASGAAIGLGSHIDFRIFTEQVSELDGGGVYLNLGSAVILPEVFLKAVSRVRNAGLQLQGFTTANLDFIQHYRPTQNVLRRPVQDGGTGIALTGHHEILVPLLAGLLLHTREG